MNDPDVVEVMLNPDGSLWVDRLGSGREPLGVSLTPADGERIIRLVAAHVGAEVHAGKPLLSAELPETGERFEGALPPVTPGPVFALRKRAVGLIRLDAYVADGILTEAQAEFLRNAVRERQNILIAGGTSTGKTTLANALLDEVAATGDRVIVLEDTVELQCTARDHVPLRTRAGVVTMAELVRSTLRPVSYTHLDVYKRQVPPSGQRLHWDTRCASARRGSTCSVCRSITRGGCSSGGISSMPMHPTFSCAAAPSRPAAVSPVPSPLLRCRCGAHGSPSWSRPTARHAGRCPPKSVVPA